MNVQEVLQIMELETLPEPTKTTTIRCIALVERSSGGKDYVIANSIGVVVDKRPIASVRKVIEYYPVAKKGKDIPVIPEIPEVKSDPAIEPPIIPEAKEMTPEPFTRQNAIDFLVSKKMNRAKMEDKTDDELKRLLKVYGK